MRPRVPPPLRSRLSRRCDDSVTILVRAMATSRHFERNGSFARGRLA